MGMSVADAGVVAGVAGVAVQSILASLGERSCRINGACRLRRVSAADRRARDSEGANAGSIS